MGVRKFHAGVERESNFRMRFGFYHSAPAIASGDCAPTCANAKRDFTGLPAPRIFRPIPPARAAGMRPE